MPSNKNTKQFLFHTYAQRKIALKFSYQGWCYNGLAAQSVPTPLPTVEQTLWDALCKGRLVDSDKSFDSAGWSRCGRTDKGVSSAGQVVALWVRSAYTVHNKPAHIDAFRDATQPRPVTLTKVQQSQIDSADESSREGIIESVQREAYAAHMEKQRQPTTEHNYIQILNSLLPPSIRVLGWCAVGAQFDARFDCQRRHYKYYFDTAASSLGPGVDIHRMQHALSLFKGEHDFRNFCKVDASKQIKNFERNIVDAWIDGPSDTNSSMHCVNLIGSAFLYHQVRCIMAVLFLVGCGRENASVITDLMRVNLDPSDPSLPIVTGKPIYDMAHDLPLCLYDCVYDDAKLKWQTSPGDQEVDEEGELAQRTNIAKPLIDQLYDLELKSAMIRNALSHIQPTQTFPTGDRKNAIPLGGNTFAVSSKFRPLLERERGDTPDEINKRWRESDKGKRRQKKSGVDGGDKMSVD